MQVRYLPWFRKLKQGFQAKFQHPSLAMIPAGCFHLTQESSELQFQVLYDATGIIGRCSCGPGKTSLGPDVRGLGTDIERDWLT